MRKLLMVLFALAISITFASSAFAGVLGAFSIKDAEGKDFKTENLKGKKSMLIFVQAACGQCRTEIGEAKQKYDAIKEKAELYFVIVDVNAERALAYFKSEGLPGKLLLDPTFSVGDASDISATPSTIVVDKDLNIVKAKTGYRPGDIDRMLKEL